MCTLTLATLVAWPSHAFTGTGCVLPTCRWSGLILCGSPRGSASWSTSPELPAAAATTPSGTEEPATGTARSTGAASSTWVGLASLAECAVDIDPCRKAALYSTAPKAPSGSGNETERLPRGTFVVPRVAPDHVRARARVLSVLFCSAVHVPCEFSMTFACARAQTLARRRAALLAWSTEGCFVLICSRQRCGWALFRGYSPLAQG